MMYHSITQWMNRRLHPGRYRPLHIGGRTLWLDMRFGHERGYFENPDEGFDPLLAEQIIRPGDVVLDAGANIGFTSLLYLARGARCVHACEPVRVLYRRLSLLADDDLRTYGVALSDADGQAMMHLSESRNQGHTLDSSFLTIWPGVYGSRHRRECVRTARVDNLFAGLRFDFVKIDVEGSELQLLQGSRQLLSRTPPRVLQVEIYAHHFAAVRRELELYFPAIKRVVIHRPTRELILVEPVEQPALAADSAYTIMPPTYLCAQSSEVLSGFSTPGGKSE